MDGGMIIYGCLSRANFSFPSIKTLKTTQVESNLPPIPLCRSLFPSNPTHTRAHTSKYLDHWISSADRSRPDVDKQP